MNSSIIRESSIPRWRDRHPRPSRAKGSQVRVRGQEVDQAGRDVEPGHIHYLEGLGGTEQGVIGALAAIGLAAAGQDGRVVHLASWPYPDEFSGVHELAEIRERGIAAILRIEDGLVVVESVMRRYRPVTVPGLPRFTGGAVGFIGYEFIHDVEPVVPRPPNDELGTPTMYFLLADQLLVFDRVAQTILVMVNAVIDEGTDPREAYENAMSEIERLVSLLEQPVEHHPVTIPDEVPAVPTKSNVPRERFLANVLKAKQYITSGDIIQVVGSQRFSTPVKASAVDVYRAARSINPSPYMFLLELENFALVGASPEIHVRCEEGQVEIRPIAGTRRRGKTQDEDAALEKELLADPKERAEHVMLVDLARNDIGRVCDFGSVQVKDLMIIERYSHVMHIVSSVEGKLAAGKTLYDLMRATFPAGTVSGAPRGRPRSEGRSWARPRCRTCDRCRAWTAPSPT